MGLGQINTCAAKYLYWSIFKKSRHLDFGVYIFSPWRELFEVLLSVLNEEECVVVSRDMESDQLVTVSQSSTSEGRGDAKVMLARVTLEKLVGAKIPKVQ